MEYIIRMLIDAGYTEKSYNRGKQWILWGDWSNRYDPTISLPDFDPTDAMLEKCKKTSDNLRTAPQGLPAEVVANAEKEKMTLRELQHYHAIWRERCQNATERVSALDGMQSITRWIKTQQ